MILSKELDEDVADSVKVLMKASFPEETIKEIAKLKNNYGTDFLKKIIWGIPGYAIPTLIIKDLEFDADLWERLYSKGYFTDEGTRDWFLDQKNNKFLQETKFDLYFQALNSKVYDKNFLKRVSSNFKPDGQVAREAFVRNYKLRLQELGNAVNFIFA